MAGSGSIIFQKANESATWLNNILPDELRQPTIAIICGSGLGGLQDTLDENPKKEIPYAQIPNFTASSVVGHEGKLVFGTMENGSGKVKVVLLVGRVHYYEGHGMDIVTFATRTCKVLGVKTLVVTNAAGGLNPDYAVGDIVMLNDHLNLPGLMGINPLRGPNESDFGVRFPPLSDAYSLSIRRSVHKIWKQDHIDHAGRRLHEGVYVFVGGPNYETRIESKMLRSFGADVVGMSTVPEVVTARHCGLEVLAFSLVTNKVATEPVLRGDDPAIAEMNDQQLQEYLSRGRANHEEVIEEGRKAAQVMENLIKNVVHSIKM